MKLIIKSVFYCLYAIVILGCKTQKDFEPLVDPVTILQGSEQLTNYITEYVNFDSDYSAFDTQGVSIGKKAFLEEVHSGAYLPLRLKTDQGENSYQLYKIKVLIEDSPKYYLIDKANQGLFQLSLTGRAAPKFEFVDLKGHRYNQENTKGKILVMKFWFIGCVACVQEMPEVNKIVDKYKGRKDMLFISLASDKAKPLNKFLKNTTFKYETVANADDYMVDSLGIKAFPSHLIIGKDGKIKKYTMEYAEVGRQLEMLD